MTTRGEVEDLVLSSVGQADDVDLHACQLTEEAEAHPLSDCTLRSTT